MTTDTAKRGTVALPGLYQPRITQGTRIAVGEHKVDANHPDKLDHIRLARWDANVGKQGSYVEDKEAMERLATWYGETYDREYAPHRVPIWLLANPVEVPDPAHPGQTTRELPKSILWTRMARYGGGVAVCACEDFRMLAERDAEQLGLEWPLDPNAIESWRGEALIRDFSGDTVTTSRQVCYPAGCPYAMGEGATCKPQTIFRCVLPFMPALGVVAEFHTTSWQTTARLRGSLLKIAAFSGGWLMMLGDPDARDSQPFIELVMQERTVNAQGYQSPILHAEYPGTMQTIKAATIETRKSLVELETRLQAIEAPEERLALDAGEGAYAFSHEFHRETLDEDPSDFDTATVVEDLARQAGWSSGQVDAAMQKHGGDIDAVIAQLQDELGIPRLGEADASDAEVETEDEPEPACEDPDAPPIEEEPPIEAYEEQEPEEDPYEGIDTYETFPEAPENQGKQRRQGGQQPLIVE